VAAREESNELICPTSRIDIKSVLSGSSPTVAMERSTARAMSYLQSVPRPPRPRFICPCRSSSLSCYFRSTGWGWTAIKPDDQLLDLDKFQSVSGTWNPTFKHIHKLLFRKLLSAIGWWNTMYVAVGATMLSIHRQWCWRLTPFVRLRYRGATLGRRLDFSFPIWCRRRSCSFRFATVVFQYGLFRLADGR